MPAGTDDVPPVPAPLLADLGDLAPSRTSDLLVHSFIPEKSGPDGRSIRVLFVRDLAPSGLRCADIGDPAWPAKILAARGRSPYEMRQWAGA